MIIDDKTKALYETLKETRTLARGTYWPELQCEWALIDNEYERPIRDYRVWCDMYRGKKYGDWYRCIAFMTYGYGNYSNNDRRRNGLPARRKSRR